MNTNYHKIYWVAYLTIIRKEIIRFLRVWKDTLLPPVITMSLYFIIFGHLIGSRVGNIGGVPYITFIAPGLIMMPIITNSFANVGFSLYLAKFARHIEEILVSPAPNWIILCGYITGGMARGLLVGIAVTITALFFTHLHLSHPLLMLIVVLGCSAIFALCGFVNAIFAKSFDDVSLIPTFVLTPLTYLGGMFYTLSMLPPLWQELSKLNPIFYIVNLFRYSLINISDVNIWIGLIIILSLAIIMFCLALVLLRRGTNIKT
jgi:ABC-2 type transport system permease protein